LSNNNKLPFLAADLKQSEAKVRREFALFLSISWLPPPRSYDRRVLGQGVSLLVVSVLCTLDWRCAGVMMVLGIPFAGMLISYSLGITEKEGSSSTTVSHHADIVPRRQHRRARFFVRGLRQQNSEDHALLHWRHNWWYRAILPPDGTLFQLPGP
jgi:hypothetical protein